MTPNAKPIKAEAETILHCYQQKKKKKKKAEENERLKRIVAFRGEKNDFLVFVFLSSLPS